MSSTNEFFDKWAVEFIDLLRADFKLSLLSSVAIVGNAGHESGGFKQLQELKPLVPGSKGGYGIMQWTGPRRRTYEAYCRRNKLDPADMMSNYKFLFVELKGPEGKVLAKLEAAKTLDEKVEVFCTTFLRPGVVHMAKRKQWANRALAAWQKAHNATSIEPAKPEPYTPPDLPKGEVQMDKLAVTFRYLVAGIGAGLVGFNLATQEDIAAAMAQVDALVGAVAGLSAFGYALYKKFKA